VAAEPPGRLRLPHPLPARECGLHGRTRHHLASAAAGDPLLPPASGVGGMTVTATAPATAFSGRRSGTPDPMGGSRTTPIVAVRGVTKRFVKTLDLAEKAANLLGANVREQVVQAVDKVDLAIEEGEVVGLVGESGCGKSTLGRIIAGILPATEGSIAFRGRDVATLKGRDARDAALKIQMIF